jgi:hypothetical protein
VAGTPAWKMLENPRRGFSQGKHFIFIEKSRISNTPLRKPATRVFQHFSFRRHDHAEPIRRSVVTRPKVKRAEQEKCDSRLFAIIRGGIFNVSIYDQLLPDIDQKSKIHLDTFFSKPWENF